MVVLLYPEILKCKNFLIDFLDELGNFKQKKIYTSKCNFFFTFYSNGPIIAVEEKLVIRYVGIVSAQNQ